LKKEKLYLKPTGLKVVKKNNSFNRDNINQDIDIISKVRKKARCIEHLEDIKDYYEKQNKI